MTQTIQSVIDMILSEIPEAPWEDSVDTIKSGNPQAVITGIATTFMATRSVIEQAQASGMNFIITHEPTFFNHEDKVDWLRDDPVYQAKRSLIEQSGVTIWRFHDYWHTYHPDGIQTGFARVMGWEAYRDPEKDQIYHLPGIPLGQLAARIKERLGLDGVRVVGSLDMPCRKAVGMVGAPPNQWLMQALFDPEVDTLICGETAEWQVCEYARDAMAFGIPKAVIVAGHEPTEEPGMAYLAHWLRERLPGVPVQHIPSGNPLKFV
jgi:putative NIF3 family GTP cyclohydrolase 1 type 2